MKTMDRLMDAEWDPAVVIPHFTRRLVQHFSNNSQARDANRRNQTRNLSYRSRRHNEQLYYGPRPRFRNPWSKSADDYRPSQSVDADWDALSPKSLPKSLPPLPKFDETIELSTLLPLSASPPPSAPNWGHEPPKHPLLIQLCPSTASGGSKCPGSLPLAPSPADIDGKQFNLRLQKPVTSMSHTSSPIHDGQKVSSAEVLVPRSSIDLGVEKQQETLRTPFEPQGELQQTTDGYYENAEQLTDPSRPGTPSPVVSSSTSTGYSPNDVLPAYEAETFPSGQTCHRSTTQAHLRGGAGSPSRSSFFHRSLRPCSAFRQAAHRRSHSKDTITPEPDLSPTSATHSLRTSIQSIQQVRTALHTASARHARRGSFLAIPTLLSGLPPGLQTLTSNLATLSTSLTTLVSNLNVAPIVSSTILHEISWFTDRLEDLISESERVLQQIQTHAISSEHRHGIGRDRAANKAYVKEIVGPSAGRVADQAKRLEKLAICIDIRRKREEVGKLT